jgi:hypothetical protein
MESRSDLWPVVALGALGLLVALYVMARQGDVVSIAILAVLGVLLIVCLGGGAVLLVMGRMNDAEERRFRQNARENWALMQQQQSAMMQQARIQNAQLTAQSRFNTDLARANRQLARGQEPAEVYGLDLDDLFDVVDLESSNGQNWS